MSEADLIQLKFTECRVERHLPLGSIGKGAEELTYKSSSLVHKLLLEAGSFATFNRVRTMAYGCTSDQGAECHIADAPAAISEGAEAAHWNELMAKIRGGII